MQEILVYLSIIHEGDWNKIYQDILDKREISKDSVKEVMKSVTVPYITLLDESYPKSLKSTFKPPFVLFYKGNINLLLDNNKKIAVIGSRIHSDESAQITKEICTDLVSNNITIVSGLAKGIDSIAHKSCLINSGKTIAVLANGLDVIYPKDNESLYKDIEQNGLLLSEYPLGVTPQKNFFLQRNRIIAAISDGVAVMEAGIRSGAMNTVSHAIENGKSIFCVPSNANKQSGCNKLIKEGAILIESAQDILDDL